MFFWETISWFFGLWITLIFVLSPFGGIYYFFKSLFLYTQRVRSKTLQDGGCDSIHFVDTTDGWKLALIHYKRKKEKEKEKEEKKLKKYPVLLCHGLSSNRMAFDMGEKSVSLAKYLSRKGFEVWVLELRGSNLSFHLNYLKDQEVRQWDFDDYLLKDIPTAIEFIIKQTKIEKIHFIGHSMGGLLLLCYLISSPKNRKFIKSGLTLGSSLIYEGSGYERLLPLKKFAERFPKIAQLFVPHGLVSQIISNFMGRGWERNPIESFQCVSSNTSPEIIRKIYRFGFHSIPIRLMLSLSMAFNPLGMTDRNGIPYLNRLNLNEIEKEKLMIDEEKEEEEKEEVEEVDQERVKINIPIFLLAGEKDLQCPPQSVKKTKNLMENNGFMNIFLKIYGKSFGQPDDYGHFDLLIGKRVVTEVFPDINQFLSEVDQTNFFSSFCFEV